MSFDLTWLKNRSKDIDDCHVIDLDIVQADIRSFVMLSKGGSDIVARTAASGWWKFEQPLPAVIACASMYWPGRFVDVGANTGFYTFIVLCSDLGNAAVCFEPDAKVLDILRTNIDLNRLGGRTLVHPVALSDHAGTAKLFIPDQSHGLVESSSSLEQSFKPHHSAAIEVELARLDDMLSRAGPVNLIKVDVEGHEKKTISGAEQTIARHRPIVVVELLDEADFDYFTDLKNRLGYVAVRLRHDQAILEDKLELDLSAWNHVLIPLEKWETFKMILQALNLWRDQ